MKTRSTKESTFRARLAATVVGLSLAAITGISGLVVLTADPGDRDTVSQLVFSSMLPLLGTWVGTVLAFYFARENFEAAARSTLEWTTLHRKEDAVSSIMIPRGQMIVRTTAHGEDLTTVTVDSIGLVIAVTGRKRVPIVDDKGSVKVIVHQSLLDSYARSVTPEAYLRSSLGDLLAITENRKLAEAIGFVSLGATLGAAREQMQHVDGCNDIFVTASGDPSDPVLGWLTDNLLATVA